MVVRQFAVLGIPSFTTWVSCRVIIVGDSTGSIESTMFLWYKVCCACVVQYGIKGEKNWTFI